MVQIPVHRCYSGHFWYWRGKVWLFLVNLRQCSHYKCIVTQNAQRRLVHAIKARQPRGGCEAVNGSCTTVLLFTQCVCHHAINILRIRFVYTVQFINRLLNADFLFCLIMNEAAFMSCYRKQLHWDLYTLLYEIYF